MSPQNWTRDAACVDKPHSWWFPVGSTNPTRAKEICSSCPVQAECLDFALTTNQQYGIWGGLNLEQRQGQREYRVIHCNVCGRRFTWLPVAGPPPRFCSATCRRVNHNKSVSDSRRRRGISTHGYGRTHGLIASYNGGCRCGDCRRAAAVAKARQRAKTRLSNGVVSGETLNGRDDAQTSPRPTHNPDATEAVR